MMSLIPVEDRSDLVRDTRTKAILSIDAQKLKDHKEKRKLFSKLLRSNEEIEVLKKEVVYLREKVDVLLKINNVND